MITKGWNVHVVPVNDLKPHNTDSLTCHCNPALKQESIGCIVIHHAYDWREYYEGDPRYQKQ